MVTRKPRLLIKAQPVPAGTRMAAGPLEFHLQPLFSRRPGRAAMGAAERQLEDPRRDNRLDGVAREAAADEFRASRRRL